MSEENKAVELSDEELEKVSGGVSNQVEGNCGITAMIGGCNQYNRKKDQCKKCPCKPAINSGLS